MYPGKRLSLHKNQSVYIQVGVLHRIENVRGGMFEFIEIQIGGYLGEDYDFGRI